MLSSQVFGLALFTALASAVPLGGPGPVVTVKICHTIDGEQNCQSSALQANQCVDMPTDTPYDNNVDSFNIVGLFSTSTPINCTLYDLHSCGTDGPSFTLQSPGGDIESLDGGAGFDKTMSSYYCD